VEDITDTELQCGAGVQDEVKLEATFLETGRDAQMRPGFLLVEIAWGKNLRIAKPVVLCIR
jgi:hypothetical protein